MRILSIGRMFCEVLLAMLAGLFATSVGNYFLAAPNEGLRSASSDVTVSPRASER